MRLGAFPCIVAWAVLSFSPLAAAPKPADPSAIISLTSATMRLADGTGRTFIFPVAVGRPGSTPTGTFRTGTDPRNGADYVDARRDPPVYGGQPFVRLSIGKGIVDGTARRPYGIHGPITPSLIWGAATAGCIRMRPADLKIFYRIAKRHPGMAITLTKEADRPAIAAINKNERLGKCAGLRPLHPEPRGVVQGKLCTGAEQWFSLSLQAEQVLTLELNGDSRLRLELYGIRALTAVAGPVRNLSYRVPKAPKNRGARYIRVYLEDTAKADPADGAYGLTVRVH